MGDENDAFMRNQNSAVQARTKAQNRANVLQLKLIGQSHSTGLTNNLLKLFEPRPPLEYKPPTEKRKCPPLTGMAQFLSKFSEPGDLEYAPPVQKGETPVQRKARIHQLRLEKGAAKAAEDLEKYDPNNDSNISGDPYKTLFVARLNYESTESRIKREFDVYGPVKRIRIVTDNVTNKPKGYCFIEYMHTRDMKAAYKQADGKKIEGKRVLVDVERGRTVPNWRPRWLGGGLGTTRVGSEDLNQKHDGREQSQTGTRPRSEEPRVREDRHADSDREKSHERGRDRGKGKDKDKERELEMPRERSHERSRDKPRDRDHREDRHHRDRDRKRERDREHGRERDRGGRDRGRDRGHDRDRDRDRDHGRHRDREHDHDHPRERERDYETGDPDHERGRFHDRESDKEHDYDQTVPENDQGWYDQSLGQRLPDSGHDSEHYEHRLEQYNHMNVQGDHDRYEQGHDGYDHMKEDYRYEGASDSHEKGRTQDLDCDYRHSERSISQEH